MEDAVFTTAWDRIFDWCRRMGVRPVRVGLGCCAFEMLPGLDPGPEVFGTAPRRGGLLVVAGPVSRKLVPLVRRLWDEMPDPKGSIVLGSCAGLYPTYAMARSLERVIPVDVHVSGCPPGTEALFAGLLQLETKFGRPEVRV
jgi:NADH-quinone oxidoreductase subunit B